mmetsp:Transcript_4888/g.11922  ORF Transcript_4888/g.11922 Transcript_4888/m.11922 type:complete len:150 (+) Transcript_4888:358-807(+)
MESHQELPSVTSDFASTLNVGGIDPLAQPSLPSTSHPPVSEENAAAAAAADGDGDGDEDEDKDIHNSSLNTNTDTDHDGDHDHDHDHHHHHHHSSPDSSVRFAMESSVYAEDDGSAWESNHSQFDGSSVYDIGLSLSSHALYDLHQDGD